MLDRILKRLALAALIFTASLVVAPTGLALEKTAARITDDDRADYWAASDPPTCSIQYYNICTGWTWLWSGWNDGDRVGTAFTDCFQYRYLGATFMFFRNVAPAGYGFTGTAAVYMADANECPTGGPVASQALLPVSYWNLVVWDVVIPGHFILSYEFAASQGFPNSLSIGSDHPAAGPTGPPACGACYPTSRTTHSYFWGTAASPVCPGSVFSDETCNAELMFDAVKHVPVSINDESWGSVKNLYR